MLTATAIKIKCVVWLGCISAFHHWPLSALTLDANVRDPDPFRLEWSGLVDSNGATSSGGFACLASIGQNRAIDISGVDFQLSTAVIPSFQNWSAHQTLGIEMSVSISGDIMLSWPRYPFAVMLQVTSDLVNEPWKTIAVPSPFSVNPDHLNGQTYFRLVH